MATMTDTLKNDPEWVEKNARAVLSDPNLVGTIPIEDLRLLADLLGIPRPEPLPQEFLEKVRELCRAQPDSSD